jgi:hypothetical protein
MRLMALGMLFLASTAWAADPAAVPNPTAAASPAATADPTLAASPVATANPTLAASPVATADPTAATPVATPYPTPFPSQSNAEAPSDAGALSGTPHILDFKPAWGAGVRGGLALPLEGQTAANALGSMAGLDAYYQGSENNTIDLMALYAYLPTIGSGVPSPLSGFGLAVKLDYDVYQDEQTSVWVGAGVGYMEIETTGHVVANPGITPTTYNQVPQSSGGLALLGCVGAGYAFVPQWSLNLEILVVSLDSLNGTSNNVLAALPDLSVKWLY